MSVRRTGVMFLLLCGALHVAVAATFDGVTSVAGVPKTLDARASAFALKDQFDTSHVYKFPRPRVSVLAFGDREGAKQLGDWIRPLYNRYGNRVDIHGVADLSAVPSLVRGIVRRIIKREVKYPVMLDWEGSVSRSYKYGGGEASIIVIDRDGRLLLRLTGAAKPSDLGRIFSQIDRLV